MENLINEIALRSMAKAVYSEKNIGHYGLAFKCYTHFTSPIRRYPDLVVHRLLSSYEQGVHGQALLDLQRALPEIARQSSERERVAMEAERASVKVMQVEYMKQHLGDEFEGVIGGVTDFGIFVEIDELLVEGLVSVRDLADDYYLYDEKHYALKGTIAGPDLSPWRHGAGKGRSGGQGKTADRLHPAPVAAAWTVLPFPAEFVRMKYQS